MRGAKMRIALAHNLRLENAETIDALSRTLGRAGHDVECIDVDASRSVARIIARVETFSPDLIFNIAEGRRGRARRGFYAALFEELAIPATGSDAYTLSVASSESPTKKVPAPAEGIDVHVYKIDGVAGGAILPLVTSDGFARAELAPHVRDRIVECSENIFSTLGIRDFGHLDFRIASDDVFFLRATPHPSLEPDGAFAACAAFRGLDYDAAVDAILRAACTRTGLLALLDRARSPKARVVMRRTSLRVGLAFNMKRVASDGGDDREAEYDSPETIDAISKAIESHGHKVVPLEANNDFPRALLTSGVDVVFNIAEGIRGRNREAQVPSLCELMGVPFTGSDSATLSICLDKGLAKRLLKDVDTPEWQVLISGREKLRAFEYPVIVKPNAEGTSKGITGKCVVEDEAGEREVAREIIEKYGQPALVEEYVFGRELTVGLLGERRPRVLPPMEVAFLKPTERPVYDYASKQDWQKFVRYEVPANVTKEELRAIERTCRTTFAALGCRDVARVDLRLTPSGKIHVIEVNPLPGLTPDYSDLCLIANGAGMDYRSLIGEILSGAIKRWREKLSVPESVIVSG